MKPYYKQEGVTLLGKATEHGLARSSIIQRPNLLPPTPPLFNHTIVQPPRTGSSANNVSICSITGILGCAEQEQELGLTPLHSEIWSEIADAGDRHTIPRNPSLNWLPAQATGSTALSSPERTTPSPFEHLNRDGASLPDADALAECDTRRIEGVWALAADSYEPVRVQNPCKIGQL
jgi:hypothetical protein